MYRDMAKRKEPFSLYTHTRSRRRRRRRKTNNQQLVCAAPELLETLSDRLHSIRLLLRMSMPSGVP